jgi:hypothetical protein
VTGTALENPTPIPDSAAPAAGRTAPDAIDAEDPEVVPAALTTLVAAARHAHAAINVNAHYPARVAVGAIEDVVAALVRITANVGPYAGDLSPAGGKAMTRAEELLVEARTELSDARHHLCLDEDASVEEVTLARHLTGSPA